MNICFFPAKSKYNKYIKNMVETIEKKDINILNKNLNKNKYLKYKIILTWWVITRKVKIFHLNWPLENVNRKSKLKAIKNLVSYTLWYSLLKLFGLKIVWTLHNKKPHDCYNEKIIYFYKKYLLTISDKIIIHNEQQSKSHLKKINHKYLNKTIYIPHGHYINNYSTFNNKLRKLYNIDDEDLIFMYFGQIREYKNVELLVETYINSNIQKSSKLLVVGNPINNNIKNNLLKYKNKKNVIFNLNFIENKKVFDLFKLADILVFPFNIHSTLNSGSIYLSLSLATPVISSEIGTIKDLNNKKYIFPYSYKNQEEHKDKLKEILEKVYNKYVNNKNILIEYGKIAKEDVEKYNNWELVGNKIKSTYFDLI